MERFSILLLLEGKNCRLDIVRTLFSNSPDVITIVWYGDDNEEIEHCYFENLSTINQTSVLNAVEDYDRNIIKKYYV